LTGKVVATSYPKRSQHDLQHFAFPGLLQWNWG